MKRLHTALLLACLSATACNTPAPPPVAQDTHVRRYPLFERLNWLGGSWKMSTPKGTIYEVWEKQNDSTYTGSSFFVGQNDTVPQETMKLVEKGYDTLLYMATVPDSAEVTFVMTSGNNSTLLFENKAHDYPQLISYRQVSRDSLYAEISGKLKGVTRQEGFPMSRVSRK